MCTDRQTHRHTNMKTAILHTSPEGEVAITNNELHNKAIHRHYMIMNVTC